MQRLLLLIILSFHFLAKAHGQAPSILINGNEMQWQTCADVLFRLPVTISGSFDPGNQFKVQVRAAYGSDIFTELPATLVGDFLEFTFKDEKRFYEVPRVQFRIVASAPKTEGFWLEQTFLVYTKGNVSLAQAAFSDSLNLYDDYQVRLTGYSTSGGWATLNDSSKVQIPDVGTFNMVKQLLISRDGPLTIAHAENECGAMTTSGTVKPIVNKTSIKTLSVDPLVTCEGAEVKVGFSVSGTALPVQTRYRIRFSDINSNDIKPNSVDVPARLENGYLIVRFPENFKVARFQEFVAQVVTDNAVASASAKFTVAAKPSAAFTSQSQTINLGESRFVNLAVTGILPIQVELSDGTKSNVTDQGQVTLTVRPNQTTSYTIKSMTSGCGNAAALSDQSVEIKVNPGIRFTNETEKQVFCGGSKAKVKFISNAALTAGTQFWIEAQNLYDSADKLRIPATRLGDELVFDAPQRELGFSGFEYHIVTTNPALSSPPVQLIDIQTKPGMEFRNYNIYDYEIPDVVRFAYTLRGGAPYELETAEGEKLTMYSNGEFTYDFYLRQNKEFRFKSISNSCFKTENLPAKNFRIIGNSGKTAISIEPVKDLICVRDSIEVTFQTFGNFPTGNQFQIQGMVDCCEYKTLATVSKPGTYKVKVDAARFSNSAYIRVASTSPVVFSESRLFRVQLLPEAFRLSLEGTPDAPVEALVGQYFPYLGIFSEKGLPYSITYTQNGEEKVYVNGSEEQNVLVPMTLVTGKVNEFVVKSVTNVCGTAPVNLKAYVFAVPYRMDLLAIGYEGWYCLDGPISVPFFVSGPMSKPATFSLQIARESSTDFTTIATTQTVGNVTGKIPGNLETGNYKMRVSSSDGVFTREQPLRIGTAPTAKMGSGADSEPIVTDPYKNTPLKIALTGGPHWTIIYEDNSRYTYFNAEETRTLNPVRGGKFFIKSVSNICGYGTTSGSVAVKVNPGLQVNAGPFNVCEGKSLLVNYSVLGDVDLSDEYVRFELVNLTTNAVNVLDSTRTISGTRMVKMPDLIPAGQFEVRVVVKKYSLRAALNVGFIHKPGAVLSGNTTINSGESTLILAENTRDSHEQGQIILSDGTKGFTSGLLGDYSYIEVSPKQTTTYTIASVKNSCGTGTASGSAVVTVNPVSDRTTAVTNIYTESGEGICAGSEISVFYNAKGSFSAGNKMTVQISDSTGSSFVNIPTTGTASPLKARVPSNLPDGLRYRIRVAASDAGVSSSAYRQLYTVAQKSKARFSAESILFDRVNTPRVNVLLEGGAPWAFRYGTDFVSQTIITNKPVYELELLSASPGQIYKIFGVSNTCGSGDIGTPGSVRIEVLTATEPVFENIRIYPNPTSEMLILEFSVAASRTVELFDIAGRSIKKVALKASKENLDISGLASGTYVVEVSEGERRGSYRVVKR